MNFKLMLPTEPLSANQMKARNQGCAKKAHFVSCYDFESFCVKKFKY